MRKKQLRYKSDYMSRLQDEELERLEERLTALYANTANEVKAEFTAFMAKYKADIDSMTQQLAAEEITADEYANWVRRHVIQTAEYRRTVETLTNMLVNTDVLAMALVNAELPLVIAQSYDFVTSLGFKAADEAGITVGTFQVYNAESVQKIIKDNPELLKEVYKEKDYSWNRDRINNEITHSLVRGDSIQQAADRLQNVSNMDKNAAIRNARTAMTAAENIGRTEAAEDIREQGVPIDEVWSATMDDKTRDTHLLMDGTTRDANGEFGAGIIDNPIRFPGDPSGDPEEIYNCRCRLSIVLKGIDHSQDGDLYEKFMKENYPEDYAELRSNETEINKQEQRYDAKQRQADLRADPWKVKKKGG